MRELIGGDLCELARDGSSDAANRGGEAGSSTAKL